MVVRICRVRHLQCNIFAHWSRSVRDEMVWITVEMENCYYSGQVLSSTRDVLTAYDCEWIVNKWTRVKWRSTLDGKLWTGSVACFQLFGLLWKMNSCSTSWDVIRLLRWNVLISSQMLTLSSDWRVQNWPHAPSCPRAYVVPCLFVFVCYCLSVPLRINYKLKLGFLVVEYFWSFKWSIY